MPVVDGGQSWTVRKPGHADPGTVGDRLLYLFGSAGPRVGEMQLQTVLQR